MRCSKGLIGIKATSRSSGQIDYRSSEDSSRSNSNSHELQMHGVDEVVQRSILQPITT